MILTDLQACAVCNNLQCLAVVARVRQGTICLVQVGRYNILAVTRVILC